MLEGLDRIPWSTLLHAHGAAGDTPAHLRNLASPVARLRDEAFEALSNSIYSHGSVYPAAVYAVGFLVELLKVPTVPRKDRILDLLFLLAMGGSWQSNHKAGATNIGTSRLDSLLQGKKDTSWADRLRDELKKHVDVYLQLLEDEQDMNRLYASNLLSWLPELREKSIPVLAKRLREEQDDQVRANILKVLERLDLLNQLDLFEEVWKEGRGELTRRVALALYITVAKESTPLEVLDLLQEALLSANPTLMARYHELLSVHDFLSDLATPLARASAAHAERILPWYIERVKEMPVVPDSCAMGLLTVALVAGGRRADLRNLSPMQKLAVATIASRAWPQAKVVNANMIDVLQMFALPRQPELMSEYLGEVWQPAVEERVAGKAWWRIW